MAYSTLFSEVDRTEKANLEAKGDLSGTPTPVNTGWARTVFKLVYGKISRVLLGRDVRNGLELILSLTDTPVTLYSKDGDYFVKGGPRGTVCCTKSFECAVGTFLHELARTVPV